MQLGPGIAVAVVQPATATLIQLLAWELPYATGEALKRKEKKRKKKKNSQPEFRDWTSLSYTKVIWCCKIQKLSSLSSQEEFVIKARVWLWNSQPQCKISKNTGISWEEAICVGPLKISRLWIGGEDWENCGCKELWLLCFQVLLPYAASSHAFTGCPQAIGQLQSLKSHSSY